MNSKLQLVIQEIIEIENLYVNKLRIVVDVFIIPLKQRLSQNDAILNENEIQIHFNCWEVLYAYHADFYSKLIENQRIGRIEENLGNLFLSFCDKLKLYKNYLINFDLYELHRSNLLDINCPTFHKKFYNFVESRRLVPQCEGKYLEMYLIEPLRQLPRYEIFLQKILNNLAPNSLVIHQSISQALIKLSDIHNENNNAFIKVENRLMMMKIMQSVDPKTRINLLDDPDRKVVKFGDVQILHNT